MGKFDLIEPLTRFEENFINLIKFYSEFSSHFKSLQGFAEIMAVLFHKMIELLKVTCQSSGRFEPAELSKIFDSFPSDSDDDLSRPDKVNPLATDLIELLKKFADADKVLKDGISQNAENEKNLVNRLWSVCVIQIFTLFENYLRDVFIEIASIDPQSYLARLNFNDSQVDYRDHILTSTTKEEIIDKVIEDSTDIYQKWFKGENFFKTKKMDFFPLKSTLKEVEQEIWKEDLRIDDDLTIREKFQKFHLYRNAIIHNGGEIREKDLRKTKVTFMRPHKVVLDRDYVRHSFTLIYCIVRHISSQVLERYKK